MACDGLGATCGGNKPTDFWAICIGSASFTVASQARRNACLTGTTLTVRRASAQRIGYTTISDRWPTGSIVTNKPTTATISIRTTSSADTEIDAALGSAATGRIASTAAGFAGEALEIAAQSGAMAVLATIVALSVFWAAIEARGTLTTCAFVDAARSTGRDALTAIIAQRFACESRRTGVYSTFSCAEFGSTAKVVACVTIATIGGFLARVADLTASTRRTRSVFVATVAAFGATFDRQTTGGFALAVVGIAALIGWASHAFADGNALILCVAFLACRTIARRGSALASEGLGIALLASDRTFGIRQALDTKPSRSTTRRFFGA